MGNGMSEAERRENTRRKLERDVKAFTKCPNMKVNQAIVMFSSSSSSNSLQQHLDKRKQTNYPTADWMKALAEKLSCLCPSPLIAGLGALAVAVFIDIISSTSSDSMKDALRGVFAEEKASEVWDHIDECLKRCMMNMNDRDELVSDIKRIECQLSAALTKLKNSMVRDGHMTSRALKAWVNGATFHVQMLIHLVRLGGIQTCDPVERLLEAYQRDLDTLFREHKEAVKNKCELNNILGDPDSIAPTTIFTSEEGEQHCVSTFSDFPKYFEAYYEEHYVRQENEIRKYFKTVRDDLSQLVRQAEAAGV